MHLISAVNVNEALHEALWYMEICGHRQKSRNGDVLTVPHPVVTIYRRPWQKVLFSPNRRANPFFHLFEAMWMLAGGNDVGPLMKYNPRMNEFADHGILRGAYGYRWRTHWYDEGGDPIDQIKMVVAMLKDDPDTRRAVINMWDPSGDLGSTNKDIPCNTQVYFRVVNGTLDMTLTCRSNDIIWGAYGANAVHFGFLHELVAQAAGYQQGTLYQISNNWHIYERHWHLMREKDYDGDPYEMYDHPYVKLLDTAKGETLDMLYQDCNRMLVQEGVYETHFFQYVGRPMILAWTRYKIEDMEGAFKALNDTYPCDWIDAGLQWLQGARF